MLYSYDVFDTVITRRTATPKGIFALMQERLICDASYESISEDIRTNFYEYRVDAEVYARKHYLKNGVDEITIEDIYRAMAITGLLSDTDKAELIRLEEDLEIENVLPIETSIEEIKALLKNGERVVLISDMYLPVNVVRDMLKKAGDGLGAIPLYLSSEVKRTKASGTLFYFVAEKEGDSFDEWTHVGDNERSDLDVPRELGINARLFPKKKMIDMEYDYIRSNPTDVKAQLLIGAAKFCRYYGDDSNAWNTGNSISAVFLFSYANWIVRNALSRGFKTLYFIARDGYLVKRIVDVILQAGEYDIKTKYIYGSRKAWRFPSITGKAEEIKEIYQASHPQFLSSLEQFAGIFGLLESDILPFFANMKLPNDNLSRMDMDIIAEFLCNNDEFVSMVADKYSEKRTLVKRYLEQEIDFSEGNIAFVEIGGTGFTQKCLFRLIEDNLKGEMYTFYFHIYGRNQYSERNTFVFNPCEVECKDAIEPLCRALHGQTVGYKEDEGVMKPVIEPYETEAFYECGYDKYIDSILFYTKTFSEKYSERGLIQPDRKLINNYWMRYADNPEPAIVNFIGDVPFDTSGNRKATYAPILDDRTIDDIIAHGLDRKAWYYNGEWAFRFCVNRLPLEKREALNNSFSKRDEKHRVIENKLAFIPDSILKTHEKIIIYGAGGLGQAFAKGMEKAGITPTLWCDKNYLSLKQRGFNVVSPDELVDVEFDLLLIAVIQESVAMAIKKDLCNMGIPETKMMWIPQEVFISENGSIGE
ncbi:MAG: hypothetical protein IJ683_07075 [Butyrivibrio sp.]|nr:hypothetical protein [Butyrivibrio sp.]MBR1642065.1 hypothetical protein [Butyrivibrio sp.]